VLKVVLHGRISNVVTTPGTARFDIRMGPSGTIVVYDTGAMNLNVVAKTNVPFWLEVMLTCRAVGAGTASNFMGVGIFQSEAVVGFAGEHGRRQRLAAVPGRRSCGGHGIRQHRGERAGRVLHADGATGSMTVHGYRVDALN
jgi:hypothetical protein